MKLFTPFYGTLVLTSKLITAVHNNMWFVFGKNEFNLPHITINSRNRIINITIIAITIFNKISLEI